MSEYIDNLRKMQADAVSRVRAGDSYAHVATLFDVSRGTVANWCRERGVQSMHAGSSTDERVAQDIVAMAGEGMSYSRIAREHSMDVKTVTRICKKRGVVSRFGKK